MKRLSVVGLGLVAVLSSAFCEAAPIPTRPLYTNKTRFRIPYRSDQSEMERLSAKEIRLYASADQGAQWQHAASVAPSAGKFDFEAPYDGEYWFGVRTLDNREQLHPPGNVIETGLKVIVDTTAPVFRITLSQPTPGRVRLAWEASDANLDPVTLQLEYIQPGALDWEQVSVAPQASGQTSWSVAQGGIVAVRGTIRDKALNASPDQSQVRIESADQAVPQPSVPQFRRPVATTDPRGGLSKSARPTAPPAPTAETAPSEGRLGNPLAQNPFQTDSQQRQDVADSVVSGMAPYPSVDSHHSFVSRHQRRPSDIPAYQQASPGATQQSTKNNGRFRTVNSKMFQIGYRLDDVGPSGVSRVELYITQDNGKKWWKYGDDEDRESPVHVDVPGDGTYGFSLRAHSGVGLADEPPSPGEKPSIVILVDQTPPVAQLMPVQQGQGPLLNSILIRWSVTDDHPADKPVLLSYAATPNGPWEPISGWQPNTGNYMWSVGPGVPARLHIRLEARDAAGNTTRVETRQPVLVDLAKPTARIVDVKSSATPGAPY